MSIGTELPFRRKKRDGQFATGSLVMDRHRAETVAEQRDHAQAIRQAARKREARTTRH